MARPSSTRRSLSRGDDDHLKQMRRSIASNGSGTRGAFVIGRGYCRSARSTRWNRVGGIMTAKWRVKFHRALRAFKAADGGNVAIIFALALIPVMTAVGVAVDYSRANSAKTALQMALDTAILAGARDGSSNWAGVANNAFTSNIAPR